MAKRSGLKTPPVHVVLDTNVLFTEAEDRLLSAEISELIMADTKGLGIDLTWHLPEVVKLERQSQMLERALRLLVPLGKLERLLGHNLNMTPDIVSLRVNEAIDRHISSHKINEITLDYTKVDWSGIVAQSASRVPPFSPSGEKGFKDAIVLEAYCQLADSLPRSSSRVILLTSDEILLEAAKRRSASHANASVADSITSLKTSLNAIAAHLPADAIATILDRAKKALYQTKDESTLWYTWGLKEKFVLDGVHASKISFGKDFRTKLIDVSALKTSFERKEGQRVFFETEVTYNLESTKKSESSTDINRLLMTQPRYEITIDPVTGNIRPVMNALRTIGSSYGNALESGSFDTNPAIPMTKETVMYGTVTFSFGWGTTLTRRGSLIKPELGEVVHKSTIWSEKNPRD